MSLLRKRITWLPCCIIIEYCDNMYIMLIKNCLTGKLVYLLYFIFFVVSQSRYCFLGEGLNFCGPPPKNNNCLHSVSSALKKLLHN